MHTDSKKKVYFILTDNVQLPHARKSNKIESDFRSAKIKQFGMNFDG